MTPRQILELGLWKYAEPIVNTPIAKPAAPKAPAPQAAGPSPASVNRQAYNHYYSGSTMEHGMPALGTGKTYSLPEYMNLPEAERAKIIPEWSPSQTPWAPKFDQLPKNWDPYAAARVEALREYGYRTGQMQRPADQQAWVDEWIKNKGNMPQAQQTTPAAPQPQSQATGAAPPASQTPPAAQNQTPQPPVAAQPAAPAPAPAPAAPPTQNPAAAAGTTQNPAQNPAQAAAQTTEQNVPAVNPALPTNAADAERVFGFAQKRLSEAQTPEQKAQAEKEVLPAVQAHVQNAPPEKVQAASAVVNNPESPEAQQAAAAAGSDFAKQHAGGDPSKLQDPGFFGQAMGLWNGLGPTGQAAFMVGVPAALIGLLSGDGLSSILGGLGIGALGIGAGAMGMMGEDTQRSMGKLLHGLGSATGFIPPELQNADNLLPGSQASKDFESQVQKVFETEGPEAAQKLIDDRVAKFDQLQALRQAQPELANALTMGMAGENAPKTRDEAAAFWDRIGREAVDPARSPTFLRDRAQAAVAEQLRAANKTNNPLTNNSFDAMFKNRQGEWGSWASNSDIESGIVSEMLKKDPNLQRFLIPDGKGGYTLPAGNTYEEMAANMMRQAYPQLYKSGSVARQLYSKYLLKEAARCWAGYEPVPGAKAYSRGSCRPVGSKKTQKEMKSGKERHHETTEQQGSSKS